MNDTSGKNKKFSKLVLNNPIIIIFILFIIDWSISTWNWIAANTFLNLMEILYYFLVLLYITLVSYMYGKIFDFVDLMNKSKLVIKRKGQRTIFDLSYTIFIWIIIRIIQFTEFNKLTYQVIFLTTMLFSGLIFIIVILTTDKRGKGIKIIEMLGIFILYTILFYPFRFYTVDLWRFILITFIISGFSIFMLIVIYSYLKGKPIPY